MKKLKESQLIINPDGSIYHLNIRPEDLANTIFLVGDPGRVVEVSKHFDKIEFQMQNREMITHTGTLNGKRLSVISTGIGPDNMDIVINELDALVNVDFNTRTIKTKLKSLNLIRLGTSGAIRPEIAVDSLGLSTHAIGLDNLARYYADFLQVNHEDMVNEFIQKAMWPEELPVPYIIEAAPELVKMFDQIDYQGFTLTAPGFYGPQGREIRLKPANVHINERLEDIELHGRKIINYEMESSSLFALSKMLGHKAVTICAIIANRANETYSKDHKKTVEKLIRTALNIITA